MTFIENYALEIALHLSCFAIATCVSWFNSQDLVRFQRRIGFRFQLVVEETKMTTHLHAGSPTSLKKTHVPPFKQNAFPITGHADPECVQLCGMDGKWPIRETTKRQHINNSLMRIFHSSFDRRVLVNNRAPGHARIWWAVNHAPVKYLNWSNLRVICGLFGNTFTLVNFLTGVRVSLFFALHSYCPESLTNADLIINSDRRLKYWDKGR